MMAFTIAGREFRTLFLSPLAWAILGIIQIIQAFLFLVLLDTYLNEIQARYAGFEQDQMIQYLKKLLIES